MKHRGEYLSKMIEENGLNVMSLSKESGVPYTTIRSMIERDLRNSSVDNVFKICTTIGITVESLYTDHPKVRDDDYTIRDLKAEIERLNRAYDKSITGLKWYGDPEEWENSPEYMKDSFACDRGKRARHYILEAQRIKDGKDGERT